MELKFIDGVSRTFFSIGILNGEACPMCIYKLCNVKYKSYRYFPFSISSVLNKLLYSADWDSADLFVLFCRYRFMHEQRRMETGTKCEVFFV